MCPQVDRGKQQRQTLVQWRLTNACPRCERRQQANFEQPTSPRWQTVREGSRLTQAQASRW